MCVCVCALCVSLSLSPSRGKLNAPPPSLEISLVSPGEGGKPPRINLVPPAQNYEGDCEVERRAQIPWIHLRVRLCPVATEEDLPA